MASNKINSLLKFLRFGFLLITFLLIFVTPIFAADYDIINFDSQITLNQDSSLTIKETIETNFLVAKHGIYRVIPYIYTYKGKTIQSKFKVLSITNASGIPVDYTIENFKQSKRLKIGDANLTTTGLQKYTIEYQVDDVVLDYGQGPEIYWNVTGTEWDTPIQKARASVSSPFGQITKIDCFGCVSSFTPTQAMFDGEMGLTIVVQIDPKNNLKMPTKLEQFISSLFDNLGYPLALIPVLTMFYLWFKLGRDKKYLTENVFYQPENTVEQNVPLFSRPHLPLVYSPINGLTPAEVGTIIDEKVDTKDIVAEIVELARLGFLTIKKIETKGFLGIKSTDYQLTKSKKITDQLNKFQTSLLTKLFESATDTKISELKNNFYKHLPDLKEKLYDELKIKKLTDGNLGSVRNKWIALSILLNVLIWVATFALISKTNNFGPIFILVVGLIPSLVFAYNMPAKTAYGYSLHRQAVGLKYYLSHGKWREEVMEKNLFLEEMLPLAITLGVVDKLAKDMKDLGVQPPSYMQGMVLSSFANDLNSFNSSVVSGLTSSPSGNSSWSGGSGFSGGGGGGFGGGGGGSW